MKLKTLLLSFFASAIAINAIAQEKLTKENIKSQYAIIKEIFTDGTCSELKSPYDTMSDEQLMYYYSDISKELMDIVLKAKNNTWAPREKEFRIAEYEPYGNTYSWSVLLKTNPYSYLQRPTGISATKGDTLLIFVGDELPSGMQLKLLEVTNNQPFTDAYVYEAEKFLARGVNMVTIAQDDVMLFIGYAASTDTTATSKKLSDYGNVKVHIEGGKVNGYFDARRHTDEDWRDMLANHFKHYSVQVRGERVIFQMAKDDIARVCPNTITDAIGWWDQCVEWQHELMGVDKYYDRWNALMMARSGHDNSYMYASHYYTYYEYSTLKDILPWKTVYANPGQMWGPAHEIGHMNQGAINIVSCTEASNNLFANVQIHRTGKTTTRGNGLSVCVDDFNNKRPFPARNDVIAKSRMFFQLYLYFHAAGKDETFYPRLFEALRNDPIQKGYYTSAAKDQLKFAEKCCEIAQMDLSEFFEAWGFFEPMEQLNVGDYGTFLVSLTKEEAEASRARMKKYSKKGGHLMFIEDRIKPSKRTDGASGNRLNFDEYFAVGTMGETGQWEDYIDESVKAQGYYSLRKANTVEIIKEENATGALGFKVLDAETGELLTFSNTYSITLPTYTTNRKLKVVAAQADGTDYEVLDAGSFESEEMQKLALEAKISSIMYIVLRTTTTGNEIGRHYADAVAQLKSLYNEAKAAVQNSDTSVHSYKEWIALIDEELERVRNNSNARAHLAELDVYNMTGSAKKGYYLCNDNMGLKADNGSSISKTSDEKCWLVESTGEMHHYYIKNKNGKYINDLTYGVGAMCSGTSQEEAIVFKANYLDKGAVYFTTKDGMYLTINSENNIAGGYNLVDDAVWNVTRIEKNNTAIEGVRGECGEPGVIYDLQGRKVTNPHKGIYIKNGRLFIK